MRNYSVHALASGASLTIEIDPPIAADERHYVITMRGSQSVVVQLADNAHVVIVNPTTQLSPFAFFVGLKDVRSAVARLIGGRNNFG